MTRILTKPFRILRYLLVFAWALLVANAQVARDVATPGLSIKPAIVRVPTRTHTPWERTLLANSITMTPGTLTLEVDEVTGDLYVHGLYVEDRESFRADLAKLERILLEAMR